MPVKSNDTAVRALEALKLLCFSEYTQEEIIQLIFETKKSDYELRSDSLYKYLNTFRLLGINSIKYKGKYTVDNLPIKTKFTQKEIETIKFLYAYSQKVCPESAAQKIKTLLQNLLKSSIDEVEDLDKIDLDRYVKNIKLKIDKDELQKFYLLCKDNQRISFNYYNESLNKQQSFVVEPNDVFVTPNGGFLRAFNPEIAEIQNFQLEYISDVRQLPVMAKSVNVKNSVTFSLKGRLGLTYELKQGERVIRQEGDCLTISSTEEDKEELLKRLLRYGVSCEILYPKTFKTKFIDTLEKIKTFYT